MTTKKTIIGADLFAGAGGLSLGASMAGIDVRLAIEKDSYAAATYIHNHPQTIMINEDIENIKKVDIRVKKGEIKLLFGGPPCQGFSTSNQRTRNKENPANWLFKEFIRFAKMWKPDWILFENVRGIVETEKGLFLNTIMKGFEKIGYSCSWQVLTASDFGIPQTRSRFFLIASKHGYQINLLGEKGYNTSITVKQAIEDLPSLGNGANIDFMNYKGGPNSDYSKQLRGNLAGCTGHLVTRNSDLVLKRYNYIPAGGNWEDIPATLMQNYKDKNRCHTGIYHRLHPDSPSVTIGNYRKAMLIHPWENRGLSVREAARIQSFPDSYEFKGSIGFQQQQVSNAVPPLLAKAVFELIVKEEK
ncbi:MAG: DNA cytosine methyltransferase [Prevotellaceae bacterium]|jgi:DNA (cytosine-5)-methyltransferase 1|nr:DNA cytosine methyltransferase [Prevotellaceae bacterium]